MKVTMEMNQVLIEQGDLVYKYLETILQGMIFLNSLTLLQMDRLQLTAVYSNRRCKYHTSNDEFSRCKSVHKMATGKTAHELIQHDNKMRIGTQSGKSRIVYGLVTKHDANANDNIHACVTLHDADVNDNIYDCVALHDAYTTDHFH